ncbi:hypothetical protein ACIRON_08900 [Nocardioides sp. NPDC101246]|uniref:hypothetical protein n=1 Tax=Nocardioides sp. NPDC101246 TaxID=3364336 RepID=UPI0038245DD1
MSDAYLTTLHTLTLKQLADPDGLVAILEQDPAEVTAALERATEEKTAMGARGSFMITPSGRTLLDDAYPDWFATERGSAAVTAAMDDFEAGVNRQVLRLTTDWQTIEVDGERQPNDHADAAYDAKVIDRLGKVLERTESVLAPLVELRPEIARFFDRAGEALTRAASGETDYVSGVRVDSFHTVWFQLHEHILRITGRERPEE